MVWIARILLGLTGGVAGYELTAIAVSHLSYSDYIVLLLLVVGTVVGAGLGLLAGRPLAMRALRLGSWLDSITSRVSAAALLVTLAGLVAGLGIAALASLGVKDLPVVGVFLLPVLFAVCGYTFAYLAYLRHEDIARTLGLKNLGNGGSDGGTPKIVDTSTIIDGRIADIVPTDFLEGDLVIPEFVLDELQAIADSTEGQRRARGRRGLECVDALQERYDGVVIMERDFPGLDDVDSKLVKLAKELGGRILTDDFNLNKVARIQGVRVLNVNDLANALKPVFLPGESLRVRVTREGKEENQGVAYLDDGTMVVVEGGRSKVGNEVEVQVTSVLQNPSGKMVFTKLAS